MAEGKQKSKMSKEPMQYIQRYSMPQTDGRRAMDKDSIP